MRYAELRQKLRDQGFSEDEITALHMQYLLIKAAGLDDDEIFFDREVGLVMTDSGGEKYDKCVDMKVVPDVQSDCVYILHDDGGRSRLGPF